MECLPPVSVARLNAPWTSSGAAYLCLRGRLALPEPPVRRFFTHVEGSTRLGWLLIGTTAALPWDGRPRASCFTGQ